MAVQNDVREVAKEVQRLEQLLRTEFEVAQRTARIATVGTAVLAAVILGFLGVNLFNIQSEYTEENFSRSLEKEMRELSPAAMRELNLLGRDVLPVYAEEASRQLVDQGPEIAARFESELDQMSTQILAEVHEQLQAAQERVLENTEKVVFENYPSLSDSVKREELEKRFREITEAAVAQTIGDFESRFGKHVESIEETLLSFDVSDQDGQSEVELQKRFIRLWLRLLDQEIMEL